MELARRPAQSDVSPEPASGECQSSERIDRHRVGAGELADVVDDQVSIAAFEQGSDAFAEARDVIASQWRPDGDDDRAWPMTRQPPHLLLLAVLEGRPIWAPKLIETGSRTGNSATFRHQHFRVLKPVGFPTTKQRAAEGRRATVRRSNAIGKVLTSVGIALTLGVSSAAVATNGSAATVDSAQAKGGKFCTLMAKEQANVQKIIAGTDSTDVTVEKIAKDTKKLAKKAQAAAPASLKHDVALVIKASLTEIAALEKVNFDITKIDPAALQDLRSPELLTASQHLTTYLTQTCGLDPTAGLND
jgi:hypothetical protein